MGPVAPVGVGRWRGVKKWQTLVDRASLRHTPNRPAGEVGPKSDLRTAAYAVAAARSDFDRELREAGRELGIETYATCVKSRERLAAIEHGWDLAELEAARHAEVEAGIAAYLAKRESA